MRLKMGLAIVIILAASPAVGQDSEIDRARAIADEVMTAMGLDIMVENIPELFADAAARSLTSCTPSMPEQDVREVRRLMREELFEAAPRYAERIRESYVRRLTLDELEALAAFYKTPEGERIAEAAGDIVYDQFVAQYEIDRAGLRAYERMGWCDNAL